MITSNDQMKNAWRSFRHAKVYKSSMNIHRRNYIGNCEWEGKSCRTNLYYKLLNEDLFLRNFHHWLHWKLSKWALSVKCSQWWKFPQSDGFRFSAPTRHTLLFNTNNNMHRLDIPWYHPSNICQLLLSMFQQDCFLPKGSYAYPSSVIIILWSQICIEKFLCVWVNETSEHTSWEKSADLKDCDRLNTQFEKSLLL